MSICIFVKITISLLKYMYTFFSKCHKIVFLIFFHASSIKFRNFVGKKAFENFK